MKLITPGVVGLFDLYMEGNAPLGNYYGGAGIAPFHDFDSQISQEIKDQLDTIAAGLADGSITTGYGQ